MNSLAEFTAIFTIIRAALVRFIKKYAETRGCCKMQSILQQPSFHNSGRMEYTVLYRIYAAQNL